MTENEQQKAIRELQTQVKKLQTKQPFRSVGKRQSLLKPSRQKTVIAT